VKKSRELAALRDQLIHDIAAGRKKDLAVDDSKTHPLPPVETNYKQAKDGARYLYGEEAVKSLKVPEGYKVELFASEKEFPNLANPMQLSFDDKGRLWVAVMPTYPHYRPGDPLPNDKILIYEDTTVTARRTRRRCLQTSCTCRSASSLHLKVFTSRRSRI
jgi:hypothetical protein